MIKGNFLWHLDQVCNRDNRVVGKAAILAYDPKNCSVRAVVAGHIILTFAYAAILARKVDLSAHYSADPLRGGFCCFNPTNKLVAHHAVEPCRVTGGK